MTRWGKVPEGLLDALVEHASETERSSAAHAVIVWAALAAKHARRDGATPPVSHACLARETGMSVASVQRALRSLGAVGALTSSGTRRGEHRGANRYRLSFEGPFASVGTRSQRVPTDALAAGLDAKAQVRALPSRPVGPSNPEELSRSGERPSGALAGTTQLQILRDTEPDEWVVAALRANSKRAVAELGARLRARDLVAEV